MKRTIAAGLSAALLCGMVVPAFAADTKTATNTTGTTQTTPRRIRRKRLITPAVRCRMQPMRSA